MSAIAIATAPTVSLDVATEFIPNSSPLYDKTTGAFYVKYNNKLNKFLASVDNDCIELSDDNVSLANNVHTKSINVYSGDSPKIETDLIYESAVGEGKSVLLLFKVESDSISGCYGNIFRRGSSLMESYYFSITSTGSNFIKGSSTDSKATLVKAIYGDDTYYGIQFSSEDDSTIYFHGVRDNVSAPDPSEYTDDDLTITEVS